MVCLCYWQGSQRVANAHCRVPGHGGSIAKIYQIAGDLPAEEASATMQTPNLHPGAEKSSAAPGAFCEEAELLRQVLEGLRGVEAQVTVLRVAAGHYIDFVSAQLAGFVHCPAPRAEARAGVVSDTPAFGSPEGGADGLAVPSSKAPRNKWRRPVSRWP